MRVYAAWALAASWATLAVAIPASPSPVEDYSEGEAVITGDKAFSLSLTENSDYQGKDAPSEMLKVRAKYGGTLSPELSEAVEINPDMRDKYNKYLKKGDDLKTSVSASPPPMYDIQYVVPVSIGTPSQETYLNLDTGSADFWTFSTDTYRPQVKQQKQYAPENSSTSKLLKGEAWNVRYGDGAGASGIVYLDKVRLGNITFPRQAVQAAIQVSSAITRDQFSSGILGLGMSSGNTVRPTPQKTFIDNIKGDLAKPLFTANLKKGVPGNYNFGYLDQSEYKGKIGYTPVDEDEPYWKIVVDGYQVGAKGKYTATPWPAIVDTGTSLLLLPGAMVDKYYAQVKGSQYDRLVGMMVFPCDAKLPDFIFHVGKYNGTVPGQYINYGKSSAGGNCHGGIQSAEGVPFAVIGDVLLKSQFVVFDIGEKRVGFAAKKTI